MRVASAFALAILTASLATALSPTGAAAGEFRLVVFGDDGTTSNTQANVNGALADGARGYVGLGDYYYWSAPSAWKSMFKPLTDQGAYLALGNHDDRAALSEFFASGTTWSKSVNGARFVAIDSTKRMDVGSSQWNAVRGALCGAPEEVRIVVMHHNWWLESGARHPGTEWPGSRGAMDQLVKDCGVDLVMAAHEHNYQRMMRNGVPHLIVGTGGQSLYDLNGLPFGTVASYKGYGRLLLDVSATGYKATFKSLSGNVKDAFSYSTPSAPAPATGAPAVSFTGSTGNEWWAQVKVGGADAGKVARVEAMDTGGAWVPLKDHGWGWAASFRIEPGHLVTYRATLSDGRAATSCAFTHPGGQCASAPAPSDGGAPDVAFTGSTGNEWWVQVKVGGADAGRVARVEARDTGGAWVPLQDRGWAWAASFRIEPGHTVEYRATLSDGRVAQSCAFTHPQGACAGSSPAGPAFSATFRNARGNAWWVEVDVDASGGTLARVEARADGGAWVALEKRSWGSWAKSVHATSSVVFRAVASDGQAVTSSAVAWPP